MRTAISFRQWQLRTTVSPLLGLFSMYSRRVDERTKPCCIGPLLTRRVQSTPSSESSAPHNICGSNTERYRNSCPWLPLTGLYGSRHGLDGGHALGSCTCVTCAKVCQLICAVICVSVRSFTYYMLLHTEVKASHRGPKLVYKNKQVVC